MAVSSNLGFPRMGVHRELKKALEAFWLAKTDERELLSVGQLLRANHWTLQTRTGIEHIPSNDFSFYDHVLDTVAMVGAVPHRYGWKGPQVDLATYFAMARGTAQDGPASGLAAMGMTKWFDTNYHYIVPEFTKDQEFSLGSLKSVSEFLQAKSLGIHTRPVLLGPISFLLLGKGKDPGFDPLLLLDGVVPIYEGVLQRLAEAGATWIQMDEPMLALDGRSEVQRAFASAYQRLASAAPSLRILLATYFAGLGANVNAAVRLPLKALHLDLVRAPGQLEPVLKSVPSELMLSLGVVDGRNIWKTDLAQALQLIERAAHKLGPDRILIAPSCSLLHSPVDLDEEKRLDAELTGWLAFARQKLEELATLERALSHGKEVVRELWDANRRAMRAKQESPRIHDPKVKQRAASVTPQMAARKSSF